MKLCPPIDKKTWKTKKIGKALDVLTKKCYGPFFFFFLVNKTFGGKFVPSEGKFVPSGGKFVPPILKTSPAF